MISLTRSYHADELRDAGGRTQEPAGRLHAPDDPAPRERCQHGKVNIKRCFGTKKYHQRSAWKGRKL